MARARFAYKQRLDRQIRAKRSFHQANSLHAHNPVVAAITRKRGPESLEPAILSTRNRGDISFAGLSRASACWVSHAHQPSKPPPSGKASRGRDFIDIY